MATLRRSVRPAFALGIALLSISACAHGRGEAGDPPEAAGSTVTEEDIQRSPGEPIEKILAGRVSGVWVTQTPNGIAVRIRGTTSIRGDNQPLYVIDGIPVEPGPNGALNGIQPYDIESIKVLKDAVDTAMYGVRGANGVILIKLKHQ